MFVNPVRLAPTNIFGPDVKNSVTPIPHAFCGYIKRCFHDLYKQETIHPVGWAYAQVGPTTYVSLLRQCVKEKALLHGKRIHGQIIESGFKHNTNIGSLLVQVYGNCGALDDAVALFAKLPRRNAVLFNLFLQGYGRQKKDQTAADLFYQMHQEGLLPNKFSYVHILSVCASQKNLAKGKRLHSCILCSHGLDTDIVLCTSIMNMYGKCACVDDSRKVFDQMIARDVVCWTAMIAIYAQHGHGLEAFRVFEDMQQDEVEPNEATFVSVLKACAGLGGLTKGRMIHHCVLDSGFELHVVGGNVLIDLYGKCGSVEDAERTFHTMPKEDVTTWNAMISMYTLHNQGTEAFRHFVEMQESGVIPNNVTFICILATCASNDMLVVGEWLHALVLDLDLELDVTVCNALLTMYGKCGSLEGVQGLFNQMPLQDTVSWNAVISAYAQNRKSEDTFMQIKRMEHEGFIPDKVTFVVVLTMCASQHVLSAGKQMHVCILNGQLETDIVVGNALINMYGKCGNLENAWRTLDNMDVRDNFSYNAVIEMSIQQGKVKLALQLFEQLLQEALMPSKVTFVSILSACGNFEVITTGKRMHTCIRNQGLVSDIVVGNALLNMYGKAGSWKDAQAVFETIPKLDRVSWNAMMTAYVWHGLGDKVIRMFDQMQMQGELPDKVTFLTTMLACAQSSALWDGKRMHTHSIGSEFGAEAVIRNALMSMYGKCGSVKDAQSIFHGMISGGGVVPWNVMISIYAQHGQGIDALQLFDQMQQRGEMANALSFVSALFACTSQSALAEGIRLHAHIQYSGLEREVAVGNALINMYGKCGSIAAAQKMFDKMPMRDVISWTTIITMYAQHGQVQDALSSFYEMQRKGVLPNDVTLLSILNGCSHAGLVDSCFGVLLRSDSAFAISDHFVSMVDLLGRAGQLEEAERLIKVMPFEPTIVSYITLLAACRHQADIQRGAHAARKIFELDPGNTAAYIMLSNACLAIGREYKAAKVLSWGSKHSVAL